MKEPMVSEIVISKNRFINNDEEFYKRISETIRTLLESDYIITAYKTPDTNLVVINYAPAPIESKAMEELGMDGSCDVAPMWLTRGEVQAITPILDNMEKEFLEKRLSEFDDKKFDA